MRTLAVLLSLFSLPALAADPAPAAATNPPKAEVMEKPKLLVLNLTAQGVTAEEAAALTDAVAQALSERNLFQIVTTRDVQTLLSQERQRALLGECGDMDCATDVGDASNSRFVLSGALSRVGTAYELSLQTIDTVKKAPTGRASRLAGDLVTLRGLVPYIASEATNSPLPPPRPRWLQYSAIASGSALIIGGGVLGMFALSREALLNDELRTGTNLRARSQYVAENQTLGTQKTLSLALMGVGAGLAAAGIVFMPAQEAGAPRMAFVFSGNGVAVAGVLP